MVGRPRVPLFDNEPVVVPETAMWRFVRPADGSPVARAVRPPFDPELNLFLATMEERGRFTLTTEMLPRMRELEMSEEELDENLRTRGLERQTFTVPGYNGDPIQLAVIQRTGRTGTAPCSHAALSRAATAALASWTDRLLTRWDHLPDRHPPGPSPSASPPAPPRSPPAQGQGGDQVSSSPASGSSRAVCRP